MEVAYILVQARHGKLKIASAALRKYEEIEELHEIYGRYDIILKVVCADRSEMKSFMQNKLHITEGIRATETLVVNDLQSGE
ncbi:Lrp/AsnC ligand binding domain-containing protein [Candidatus Woesearchaeota archaeon]|nr:Lrp/AsnC ligand binding domain-containing protein [Candidatus Woesearchaeota archaeon]